MNKLFLLLAFLCSVAYSQNDTIKVRSHNQTDLSEHGAYDQTVIFPQENSYEKILMNFTMGCASGGCSDWDYTVSVYLMEPTGTSDLEKFELARLITPYGSYMDGSQSSDPNNLFDDSWEHSYIFDVTDFAPLLRDSSSIRVYYDGWSSGFSATVDFDFIQGTPAREVLGIENMYPVNEYSYRSLADDENYPAITRTFDENVKGVAVKSYISGHKHEGPQNCCEWVPKQHSIAINGSNIYQWYVWKDCGMIPIYPQGGTWPFDRAGWCPGTAVDLQVSELTDFIDAGEEVALDYRVQLYSSNGEDAGTFIVSNTLFSYGSINFQKDVEITDIIKPTTKDEWSRMNPICASPVVEIRNRGSEMLTSATIKYGLEGEELSTYRWTGAMEFLESVLVELPAPDWSGVTEDSKFSATVILEGDEYEKNNTLTSDFDIPEVLPGEFVFEFRTQTNYGSTNRAAQSSFYIYDREGALVFENSSGLEPYTWYKDTINLPTGCYELVFKDAAEDGVNERWYNGESASAAGKVQIRNMEGQLIKKFPDDFGQQIDYRFTVNYPLEIEPIDEGSFGLYPNPAHDFVVVSLSLAHAEDVDFVLYNSTGDEINRISRSNFTVGSETIDTRNLSAGIYYYKVITASGEQVKKLVLVD